MGVLSCDIGGMLENVGSIMSYCLMACTVSDCSETAIRDMCTRSGWWCIIFGGM